MIALILGGAMSVWDDHTAAEELLCRGRLVVAANLAGIQYPGRLDAWATLHPDEMPGWMARRQSNVDYRTFTPADTPERWPGSSGLYAAQVALFEMGAAGVILCGVPMDSEAGHFTGRTPWESVTDYRQAFVQALPEIGGRVRSMGGWTQALFGAPTSEWIDAIHPARPLGVTAPAHLEIATMLNVKNATKATRKVWARGSDGNLELHHIAPGEAMDLDVDKDDPALAGLSLTEPRARSKTSTRDAD